MKYLHTMIRVTDPDATIRFFNLLGLNEVRRMESQQGRFTLIFMAAPGEEGQAEVELTYNWDPEDYSGGRNFGHLAYRVDNIYETCQRLMDGGVTINRPPRDGHMAFVRTPDNISVELLQDGHLPPPNPGSRCPIRASGKMGAAARAFLAMTGARLPIVQAPMANFAGTELAIAATAAGGVGSLPCAVLDAEAVVAQAAAVRAAATGPLNLNFFCHTLGPQPDETAWRTALAPFYAEEGVAPPTDTPPLRRPFDAAMADAVGTVRPEIVSFHFGLPDEDLLDRVKATGALVFGCATNVAEARYLAERGCDAVIAQGFEAGGHAGHFLMGHRPVGLIALVPQIVDAIHVPVIAAGGIADARGVAAAIALGAGGGAGRHGLSPHGRGPAKRRATPPDGGGDGRRQRLHQFVQRRPRARPAQQADGRIGRGQHRRAALPLFERRTGALAQPCRT